MAKEVQIIISAKDLATGNIRKVGDTTVDTTKKVTQFGETLGKAGRGLSTYVTAPIVAAGYAIYQLGPDVIRTENLFGAALGNMADDARAWSESVQSNLGFDSDDLRRDLSDLMLMFDEVGVKNRSMSLKMSEDMAVAARSVALLRGSGKDIPGVMEAMRNAVMGNTRSLRQYGIYLSEGSIANYAYRNGIAAVGEKLTTGQQIMARYGLIMQMTRTDQNALGDSLNSTTGKLYLAETAFKDAAEEASADLLPALTQLIYAGIPLVKFLGDMADRFSKLSPETQQTIIKLVAFAAILGPVASGISGLISGGAAIVKIYGSVAPVIANAATKFSMMAMGGKAAGASLGGIATGGATAGSSLVALLGPIALLIADFIIWQKVIQGVIDEWDYWGVNFKLLMLNIQRAWLNFLTWINEKAAKALPFMRGIFEANLKGIAADIEELNKKEIKLGFEVAEIDARKADQEKNKGNGQTDWEKWQKDFMKGFDPKALLDGFDIPGLAASTRTAADVVSDLDKELLKAARMEGLLGDQYDESSAKVSALTRAIEEMVMIDPNNPKLQEWLKMLNELARANIEAVTQAPGFAETVQAGIQPLLDRARSMIKQAADEGKSEVELLIEEIDSQIAAFASLAVSGEEGALAYFDFIDALKATREELSRLIPVAEEVAEIISPPAKEIPALMQPWVNLKQTWSDIKAGWLAGQMKPVANKNGVPIFGQVGTSITDWLTGGKAALGSMAASAIGSMPVVNSVMQGAASGAALGPAGIVGGALAGMISQSETFKDILANLNPLLQSASDMVGAFLEPLLPLIVVISSALSPAISVLSSIMSSLLLPVMQTLFPVFKGLGLAVIGLSIGIGTAWNAIATAINWALGWLGVNLNLVDMEGLSESWDALIDLTWDNAMAQGEAADAANECANALRNVPSGFKIALERFRAAEGISGSGSGGYSTPTPPVNPKQPASGPPVQVIVNGPVYGVDDLERRITDAVSKASAKLSLARSGLAGAGAY